MPDEPDATAPFDRPTPPAGDPDATSIGPAGGPADPDATRIGPANADPDATRIGGGTSPLRPDDSGATRIGGPLGHDEPPRWTARANVPQPGDPALRQSTPEEWIEEDPYQGRSWFTPVIIGVVALILVGALSVGLYLIYQATADGDNAPQDQVPGVDTSSSTAPSPTSRPTTAAPSSAPPSATATTGGPPSSVAIPPLRGNTLAQATIKLQQLGLEVKVVRRADGSVQPGEVLESDPGPGQMVAVGEAVTLYVATAPTAAPSKSSVSPSTGG
jgi:hypothetical protein